MVQSLFSVIQNKNRISLHYQVACFECKTRCNPEECYANSSFDYATCQCVCLSGYKKVFELQYECVPIGFVPLTPSEAYTHFVDADQTQPGQYQLYWKSIGSDEIQFEVHCKSTGWVGLGLSSNGGMTGADIAIGWVSNDQAHLKVIYG